MFSPERYGQRARFFSKPEIFSGTKSGKSKNGPKFWPRRGNLGSNTSSKLSLGPSSKGGQIQFSKSGPRKRDSPLNQNENFVQNDRGFKPSDLSDSTTKNFLNSLTNRVFHLENGDEAQHDKIPLERLFTPASDAAEIVPQKKKKAFASSCFYGPNHPTIDEQVELAHKISVSLVDENNKASRGQSMYMRRKNRSSEWIHQAPQYDGEEEQEDEKKPSLEKPPLKLVLSPKGIQDYTAVQKHYEELMAAAEATVSPTPPKLDISKAKGADLEKLESPTGKGAALFARRKKRMDKFIVDENTLQQHQQQQQQYYQQHDMLQHDISKSTNGHDITTNNSLNGHISYDDITTAPAGGLVHLPDLDEILTSPKPSRRVSSSGTTKGPPFSRSRLADSKSLKTKSWYSPYLSQLPQKSGGGITNGYYDPCPKEKSNILNGDPLKGYERGSPPLYMSMSNLNGNNTKVIHRSDPVKKSKENYDGNTIYTADVKVVQKSSVTPNSDASDFGLPGHSLLNELENIREEDKRKSFNLAAKGWGTYFDFYTPLHVDSE